MTNKGMAAINEALTVVEQAPTVFSNDDNAVPASTVMILEFMLKLANHARDNKDLITKMIKDDDRFQGLNFTDDMTISVYLLHVITRAGEFFNILNRMPPGYPPERLVELLNGQLEQHKTTIAKHGVAVV